jgi:hypothetical protein
MTTIYYASYMNQCPLTVTHRFEISILFSDAVVVPRTESASNFIYSKATNEIGMVCMMRMDDSWCQIPQVDIMRVHFDSFHMLQIGISNIDNAHDHCDNYNICHLFYDPLIDQNHNQMMNMPHARPLLLMVMVLTMRMIVQVILMRWE